MFASKTLHLSQKHNLKCAYAIRLLTPFKVSKIGDCHIERRTIKEKQWCIQTAGTHEKEIKLP